MYNLQFLLPSELDGIGIYWQMTTDRSSQLRLLRQIQSMAMLEGPLLQTATKLPRMLQRKELSVILVLYDLTLNPRIKTHHSRTLLGVMYQKISREPKPKLHLARHLAPMMETCLTLIFLLSSRSPVLLSLKVLDNFDLCNFILLISSVLMVNINFHEYAVAEDDPLPAIDGLRITGEAFPGKELQASGYSINGTTSCNFEWVRHLEDGSVNYIEGAKQPTYLVTADDVDSLLAIEVQPLDDRKRKGEIVKVYANEQRKITCDPEMKELIKKILSAGHVSYEVLLPINIPYGHPTEFSIQSADGAEYNLKPGENSPSRDSIVLILRLFRMKVRAFLFCLLDALWFV
uniref:AIR9-like A9 domain-containing protein n=1 Tax=Aegilops tauschii subsp. strangulata TaxID=200361 RepID=A0A452XHM8_AEGTS